MNVRMIVVVCVCVCVCAFTKRVCTECVSVELVLSLSLALTHPDNYIDTATHHGQQL